MRLTSSLALLFLACAALGACRHADLPTSPRTPGIEAAATPSASTTPRTFRFRHGASPFPPPTEHHLEEGYEKKNKTARKAWWAQMHRTAPGLDWKAIERSNGLALRELREELRLRKGVGDGAWTERGSRNQAGRMHAVALSLDGSTLYGGSAKGGVWRGGTEGQNWEPISDHLFGGCHGLAVGASPAETLTATTTWGRVVYTLDDGLNWLNPTGLAAGINRVDRIASDPVDPSRLYLLSRRGANRELWRSLDGGLSYSLSRGIGEVPADFWLDRLTGDTLFLMEGADILRSDDRGASWLPVGTIPGAVAENVHLAGSEAGAPTLYATVARGGTWQLHHSGDAGVNWDYRTDVTDFWGTLAASIENPSLVVTGGVEVHRSDDSGQTFNIVNGWAEYYGDPANKLHADVPGIEVTWQDGAEVFWVGTDGGLYRSDDQLQTVSNLSLESLRVSQYYSTHTSVNDPDLIIAGSQDQGYQRSFGPLESDGQGFDQVISGDYANLTSTDGTHEWLYSVYPGFILVQRDELSPWLTLVDFPPGETHPWLPFVYADPLDREAFFFCASQLYRYSIDPMSDEWVFSLALDQDFTEAGGNALSVMTSSPLNPDLRLAATNNGAVWYSTDGGESYTASPDRGPSSFYLYGSALEFSPIEPLTAYLGGSGYSGPGVYRTEDGGLSWTPVNSGLPRTMVYDLCFESDTSGVVYAATEAGPYALPVGSDTWEYIGGTTAPLTTYFSVEAVSGAGLVRYGTYGRGIWDYSISVDPEGGNCDDAVDNDRDGLTDCADPDCSTDSACPEDCGNGLDDDADGAVDCADAECDDVETDGDGIPDCVDCAPEDANLWAPAPGLSSLSVSHEGAGRHDVVLRWSDEGLSSGAATAHDVFVGRLEDLWRDGDLGRVNCVADDQPGTSYAEGWPINPGQAGYWYLVRADNACGTGPAGPSSQGQRVLPLGPCD